MSKLTHLDEQGAAHMVDVSAKDVTRREATAVGHIAMSAQALAAIRDGAPAKRTSDLIPLCHPLPIASVGVDLQLGDSGIDCRATVVTTGKTGVEMEALTAVSVALLALYDMAKALDRGMTIGPVRLLAKSGGRSGDWRADG